MIINKNSWHYRFINHSSDKPVPTSLCPYVRRLMVLIFFWAFVVSLLSGLCITVGLPIATATGWATGAIALGALAFGLGIILVSAGVVALLALSAGVYYSVGFVSGKIKNRKEIRQAKIESGEIKETLAESWIKAKHDKICPQIEFK